ncbi:hypothetical protein AAHE18_08G190400 [Arachis hypogaea]
MAKNGAPRLVALFIIGAIIIYSAIAEFHKTIYKDLWVITTSYYIAFKVEDCVGFCKTNAHDINERNGCIKTCVFDECRRIHWKDLIKLKQCVENLYAKAMLGGQ